MAAEDRSAEARAIEQLIARQFASVSWAPGRPADWQAFVADSTPMRGSTPRRGRRGVEVLLLIKNGGGWQIVSQAWDVESEGKPLPERLLAGTRRD
jgi:hypothetical protein